MTLELRNVSKIVGQETHINSVSIALDDGSLNVLLGPTLAGKTSLMRLMAGLDAPTSGTVIENGHDVTGLPVQNRNVAMVYQQFINYPNLTVYENIASPLKVMGRPKEEIKQKVGEAVELLKLGDMLDRTPLELSGGQQQRTALARALVKGSDLVLLDEPLANLDYKLREELRDELPKLFGASGAILIYATTEPMEALLLGGNTATLHEGCITQFGPTVEVFRKPNSLITAQTFSDPPMNLVEMEKKNNAFQLRGDLSLPAQGRHAALADARYIAAFRPNHLLLQRSNENQLAAPAKVVVSEITGSESFVHVDVLGKRWVALAHGIHEYDAGQAIDVYLDAAHFFVFTPQGDLAVAPDPAGAG